MKTISKSEFLRAKASASTSQVLTESIQYKRFIQYIVLFVMTDSEREDIRDCRLNESLVEKLCKIGAEYPDTTSNPVSLYACSVAIATIIKEYEWGEYYLSDEGLFNLAKRILDYSKF